MSAAAVNALSKYTQKCSDCGSSDFVEDFSAGDLVCQRCGVVAESHTIDERSEWRTFGDSNSGPDPTRVGAANNNLLDDYGIGNTSIVASGKDGGITLARQGQRQQNLQRTQMRNSTDQALMRAFREVNRIADRLNVTKAARDTAMDYYRMAHEIKGVRGRSMQAVAAAVLFCGCRQERQARTFKEIEAAVPDASKKDIGRAYKAVAHHLCACALQLETVQASAVSDYMRRFCSRMGMPHEDIKACVDIADKACPRDGSRQAPEHSPSRTQLSQAAALIFIITRLPRAKVKPSAEDIARECGVVSATLYSTYRDFYPQAQELVPEYFASKPEIYAALPKIEQ
eukprot:jgi/Astpho2/2256/e_gw1.00040.97.1_t